MKASEIITLDIPVDVFTQRVCALRRSLGQAQYFSSTLTANKNSLTLKTYLQQGHAPTHEIQSSLAPIRIFFREHHFGSFRLQTAVYSPYVEYFYTSQVPNAGGELNLLNRMLRPEMRQLRDENPLVHSYVSVMCLGQEAFEQLHPV